MATSGRLFLKKLLLIGGIVLLAYLGSYVFFRAHNTETWEKDQRRYLIFPSTSAGVVLYYFWRPLCYLDGALTDLAFHIGPHQE